MTKRVPPSPELNVHAAAARQKLVDEIVRETFEGGEPWETRAGVAAIARLRPDLGLEVDHEAHAMHMWQFPRNDHYFARVCRLLKLYGIGKQWGD